MLSDARESTTTTKFKKGVIKEFFSEITVVLVMKGFYTTLNMVKERETNGKRKGKSEKPGQ